MHNFSPWWKTSFTVLLTTPTLVAVESSQGARVAVTESLNCDLNRVSMWCDLCGMKLNVSKTKSMIVSRSCTIHPQSTPLTLDLTVLKESADLILWVMSDSTMTFEKHLCSVLGAAAQRLGIMRKSWQVFHDPLLHLRSFWSFVLPVLGYCSAVDSYFKLLDRVVRSAGFLSGSVLEYNLTHRKSVVVLCVVFKIKCMGI